ncbi:MAG: HEAT repeat domain-containing protein [Pirellulales bacterium]|nr:HEAT repeat domain-containing protein [Pirellulales bacterium]
MFTRMNGIVCLTMALLLGCVASIATADEALDKAFEALKTYKWGQDRATLGAIDAAVVASHKDDAAKKDLEAKLVAVLKSDAPQAAKDFVCRKLSLIGSAASVPALAALLPDEKLSHMGRYALERMPCDEAVAAMRDGMGKVKGLVKVGVINSLGVRRDAASTAALVGLLEDSDPQIAGAAAAALGAIGSPDAAKALGAYQAKAPKELKLAAADAYLACAERLLADGKANEAKMIYMTLAKPDQPKHVRLAATRGLLAAAGQK